MSSVAPPRGMAVAAEWRSRLARFVGASIPVLRTALRTMLVTTPDLVSGRIGAFKRKGVSNHQLAVSDWCYFAVHSNTLEVVGRPPYATRMSLNLLLAWKSCERSIIRQSSCIFASKRMKP
jgi:hypothetical protein